MSRQLLLFFFFNDTATTEIYTLSLHDALPILAGRSAEAAKQIKELITTSVRQVESGAGRSEEHTSELQSLRHLVCRLLLEKKKSKEEMPSVDVHIQVREHWDQRLRSSVRASGD